MKEMVTLDYDQFVFNSFPSSLKLVNKEDRLRGWWVVFDNVPVTPSSVIQAEIAAKSNNVQTPIQPGDEKTRGSYLTIYGSSDGETYRYLDFLVPRETVRGIRDWGNYVQEHMMPEDVRFIRGRLVAAKGETWFDDLKIYQNGVLIYTEDFTNWAPYTLAAFGAGIGGIIGEMYKPIGPIVSPLIVTALGAMFGAGIGYALTSPVISTS